MKHSQDCASCHLQAVKIRLGRFLGMFHVRQLRIKLLKFLQWKPMGLWFFIVRYRISTDLQIDPNWIPYTVDQRKFSFSKKPFRGMYILKFRCDGGTCALNYHIFVDVILNYWVVPVPYKGKRKVACDVTTFDDESKYRALFFIWDECRRISCLQTF